MASTFSLSLTKWSLDLATKLIKADVRLHNVEAIKDDMAIIFVVNHFTRLETILLPYVINKHTGKEVWGLAAAELFKGKIGEFLKSTGTISTKDPDRDTIIIHSLLKGQHPWMIFPEGAMIKDKKVVDHRGEFQVYNDGQRRPPHTGAAVLALLAEYYRHKIQCLADRPGSEDLPRALKLFDLTAPEEVLSKRTVIIPVNITYFPMRSGENVLMRMANRVAQDLSPRAMEELSVEGTVISEETDIDISLGDPIDVREYLAAPEYAELMACGLNDFKALEEEPSSVFNNAARKLMQRYMREIYQLTTINFDHLFATIIRHQGTRAFTERMYRNRIFLCARQIRDLGYHRLHTILEKTHRALVYEDESPKFQNFMTLCLKEGVLLQDGEYFRKNLDAERIQAGFHDIRFKELTEVIANEIEPLGKLTEMIRQVARMPRFLLSKRIRDIFIEEDLRYFETDYARFYIAGETKGPDVGRPFLLKPMRIRAGVVLAHGYMAAPLEVRALAEYLYQQGYAVYAVRLRGHGTSPEDLALCEWEDWYESFNRGYAIIKSLTDNIILGGFSTGGCLALMGAARKRQKVQAVFSICAPLQVRNYSIRLVPSIVSLNSMLKKIGQSRDSWEYVVNEPENKHINYVRNPLTGVSELVAIMGKTESLLPEVQIPALIIQASKDSVVNPASGQLIFDRITSPCKELTLFERARHGIVNGEGREDIFARVHEFLKRAPGHGIGLRLTEDSPTEGAAHMDDEALAG
ncbi:MAG: alpha/beta fold hydrolase [Candidatus Hydrogenedentes bacterium]|nr:alpha/beta fold hydrolase [Candidatus Hydrogenedentota bacterium]